MGSWDCGRRRLVWKKQLLTIVNNAKEMMTWNIYERNCALVWLYKKYVIPLLLSFSGKEPLYIHDFQAFNEAFNNLSSILIRKDCIDLSMNCAIYNMKMLSPCWGRLECIQPREPNLCNSGYQCLITAGKGQEHSRWHRLYTPKMRTDQIESEIILFWLWATSPDIDWA